MHFLRRMKEELRDHDKQRPFHDRHALNVKVPLSSAEYPFYDQALNSSTITSRPRRSGGWFTASEPRPVCTRFPSVSAKRSAASDGYLTRPPGPGHYRRAGVTRSTYRIPWCWSSSAGTR